MICAHTFVLNERGRHYLTDLSMHLHGWPALRTRSLAIHLAQKFCVACLSRPLADSDLLGT